MDGNQRLILAVGISIAILLGFQWLAPKIGLAPDPATVVAERGASEPSPSTDPKATADAPAPEAPSPAVAAVDEPAQAPAAPARQVELRTDRMHLVFSTHGAGLVSAELLGRKGQRQGGGEAPQVDLAAGLRPQDPVLFDLALEDGLPQLAPRSACTLESSDSKSASFLCRAGDARITKRYEVTGDRTLALTVQLQNAGAQPMSGTVDLLMPALVDPARQASARGCAGFGGPPPQPTQNICRVDDKIVRHLFDEDKKVVRPDGAARFAGIEERYFLAVAVPAEAASCTLVGETPELLVTHLKAPVKSIAPGGTAKLSYDLVIGQKEMGFLQEASARIATQSGVVNPELDQTVDLGFWAVIARILLWLLNAFHHVIHNWGVAIILLTVAVKVVTLPLAWKSMKSMEEMRKLAPEIAELKKKFGNDREKLNVETMKLYQQHKVNPLGGCLPMLIQMPIWLALYTTLQTSVELYNEPFITGWISDLTSKDPFYALPLAMGATMFITQRMQPMQMDATQQKVMLYFMPIFFTFIMFQLPAGLTLYIFTNNLLSIGQQLVLRKSMGLPAIGAPTPPPASKTTIEVKAERKPKKKGK
ncbi:MAG TPA: membrane protein insertase YidC [Vulgatibacter sp.]